MPTQITMNMADLERKLGMITGKLRESCLLAVADWLRYIISKSFQNQRSPEGVAWAPLKPASETAKAMATRGKRQFARMITPQGTAGMAVFLSGRRILERTDALRRSIDGGIVTRGNSVFAASRLPYAAAHQYGASINIPEIRPHKENGTLRWFGPSGEPIFAKGARAHRVTLPARPFLPSPAFAAREAAKVCEEIISGVIRDAGAA
jgi:phage gpG-like protein